MANVLEKQILEEGYRNAVVKLTGVLTASDENRVEIIALGDFLNNDRGLGPLKGFRVDTVNYSLGQVIDVTLYWNANTPQQIVPLSKSGKIDVTGDGGFIPDMQRSGYTGGINLVTTGFPAGGPNQNYTILLRLVKLY